MSRFLAVSSRREVASYGRIGDCELAFGEVGFAGWSGVPWATLNRDRRGSLRGAAAALLQGRRRRLRRHGRPGRLSDRELLRRALPGAADPHRRLQGNRPMKRLHVHLTVDDLAANGLLGEADPQGCWERSIETLTAMKNDIAGIAIASDERIEAYLLYVKPGIGLEGSAEAGPPASPLPVVEIVSLRTFVEERPLPAPRRSGGCCPSCPRPRPPRCPPSRPLPPPGRGDRWCSSRAAGGRATGSRRGCCSAPCS